jgi:DNA-binding transcriptional LysR family regulator
MAILMTDIVAESTFKSMRLWTERIFLLGDPAHPLAKRRTVKPADMAGQMLLLTEQGCGYREKLDRMMALQNVRPGNVTEFSSVEAIKQCVVAGMGLGLLPAIVVSRELQQHQFKALAWAGPTLDIQTHLIWHKDKWVSPAMAAFQELMLQKLEDVGTVKQRVSLEGSLAG